MHRLTLAFTFLLIPACGDDGEPSGNDASSSGSGAGTASSGSTAEASASSGGTMTTSPEDSTGQPPETSTGTTTTEPSDSSDSSDSGMPLEGDVLQNDSWTPADALTWQMWPNTNDCWASVFQASPMQYPLAIVGAVAAIGNGDGVHTFEVAVWEVDNQGMPTNELGTRTIDIDGTTTALTEIDLSGLGLPVVNNNGEFAVVMCHTEHMGFPSIAVDADGTVDAGRNWVYQQAMGQWVPAPDFFGIDGDFILRAVIMPQ